jgi:hypothetical protein
MGMDQIKFMSRNTERQRFSEKNIILGGCLLILLFQRS